MRSRTKAGNLLFDPEIERIARRNNSRKRKQNHKSREVTKATSTSTEQVLFSSSDKEDEEMAGNHDDGCDQGRRTLEDYASFPASLNFISIDRPVVNAVNMEMKPALIHLVQVIMASEKEVTIPLRYCVDDEKRRVIVAEATGDFIDVLFSFLTLPLGTIIRLANKFEQRVELGCVNKLDQSVDNLDSDVFWNNVCKKMLLSPRNPLESSYQRLKVRVDDTEPTRYFMCHTCSKEKDLLMSTFDGAKCQCGKLMKKETKLLVESKEERAKDNGVFVKPDAMLLIFDDLRVLRSSPDIEHTKASIISKSPLSDVLLENRGSKKYCFSGDTGPVHWKGSVEMKVMVSKSKNKILFAEAEGDFVDFLVSFLTIPIGSIMKVMKGKLCLGSIGNLYTSVKDLNPSWFVGSSNESLLNIKIAPHFGCKSNPLEEEDSPQYWYGPVVQKHNEGRTMISNRKDMLRDPKKVKLFDPRSIDGAREAGVGFMKRPCLFVVSDDLKVIPMTTASSILYLKELGNGKLNDLEEHYVKVRKSHEVIFTIPS
ncbi:uncharacterized protein LOC114165613 [Vigna unguiculata]|uniref:uncharacterized protein LOC114165613 n=1 Tax=Vigna unguiculata TaxID=3917 RepID=UPI0010163E58|nr:uncharacterized protein LOC114165613 [Vigna unguiculata]